MLDQRGKLYSGRPEFPVTQDILSGGNRIVMMGNTPRWRNLRKVMHQLLMASNVSLCHWCFCEGLVEVIKFGCFVQTSVEN